VEILENIFFENYETAEDFGILLFVQLHLLTIKYLDSMELLQVITFQLSASIICVNATDYSEIKCHIIKKDYKDRIHYYDLEFPFFLKYFRYSCHGKYFIALDPQLVQRYHLI
jgi:hypothetical protein